MAAGVELTGVVPGTTGAARTAPAQRRPSWTIPLLLLSQAAALLAQAVAAALARSGNDGVALPISFTSLALAFAGNLVVLTRSDLTRAQRNTAVVCLGLVPTLQWRALNPLLFTGFDEQLHVRTLRDIQTSHGLFSPHPLLAVSSHYPGLESVTALLGQAGLPLMAAATVTVLLARLVLVLTLSDAVEQMTGSVRAGGLAVAVYAVSPQYIFFNSQFSYQTLALPLALAAVALIGRACHAADARPQLAGAAICLLAVAVTHHITSLLTATFLVLWAAVARGGHAVRRIRAGALVGVAATTAWALVQWSLLRSYFQPIISDVAAQARGNSTGGARREAFVDPSGYVTPPWERLILLYYAAVVSLTAAVLVLISFSFVVRRLRPTRHARPRLLEPTPQKLVILLAALLPLVFAVRLLPSGGEFGDRATSFVFFPFSLIAAAVAIRAVPRRVWQRRALRWVGMALAIPTFIGGYILGSGPDWARVPGSYLVSAEGRSMDSETLAAVGWAAGHLAPGSRIGADRISSDLLSSQARLWPVMKQGKVDVPSLYFADQWGPPQTEQARQLRLSYLYVDTRLATELPHVGSYFYRGETAGIQQLTAVQLDKFADVPGIEIAYRHGPVTIYDLQRLRVPDERSGWTGTRAPPGSVVQMMVGILIGSGLALGAGSGAGRAARRGLGRYAAVVGPSLALATAVGSVCVLAVVLILCHAWLGPWTFGSAAVVVLAGHRHILRHALYRALRRIRAQVRSGGWARAAVVLLGAVVAGTAAVVSVSSAYSVEVRAVHEILTDLPGS